MPGPYHGLLYVKDHSGGYHEVINHARTAAYLSNPDLAINGISICDVLDFMGCETYAYEPRCAPEGGWIEFPGLTGNQATVPDAADLDITGDITLEIGVALSDTTPATNVSLFGKGATYRMRLATDGDLFMDWVDGGAGSHTEVLDGDPVGTYVGVDQFIYLALTLNVNNGAGQHVVRGWRSIDRINWVQLGADNVNAGTTSIQNSSNLLRLGTSTGSADFFDQNIRYARVGNGIGVGGQPGGTTAFEFDGSVDLVGVADGTTSVVVSSGQTMTIAYSGGTDTMIVPSTPISDWDPLVLSKPADDPAPWYNAAYPQSADALGFFIEEWTGLDDGHVNRPTTAWGGLSGGAALGAISAGGRVMAVNLLLFGRTEEATEYLFRWLAATLTGVCQTCATDSIAIRRFCGSTEDPWNGMTELRRVGLTVGLKWESEPLGIANCSLRRASFTLTAGDPCMYLPDTEIPVDADNYDADLTTCFDTIVGLDPGREFCRPGCSELNDVTCRTSRTFEVDPLGAMAPIVTWYGAVGQYTYPFRAIVYADPNEVGTTPNPCGLPILGEVYVRPLPPSAALRWDVVGRTIEYRDHTTGGWVSGAAFIEANDPPRRRFFALPCGKAHLVMEPSSLCAENTSGDSYDLDAFTFDPPQFPSVDVRMGQRLSCP